MDSPKPVLLEAFHYRFHPAWTLFKSLIIPSAIVTAQSALIAPAGMFPTDDIRFKFNLAGGSLMDVGTYTISTLRQVFAAEPVECISAFPRLMPAGLDQECDQAFVGSWRFPNGGVGSIDADLARTSVARLPAWNTPKVVVTQKPTAIQDERITEGQTHEVERAVTIWNFIMPVFWHRIDVVDQHTIRDDTGKLVRKWTEQESKKAYTWTQVGNASVPESSSGEEWWTTYRYMVEEFVSKIKGREGSGVWVDGTDSVRQMEAIDAGYIKSGMPLRPTSEYR